ncbi:MAG: aminoglycoside phosphotransferase family protein [Pseudomonadales bacterium]
MSVQGSKSERKQQLANWAKAAATDLGFSLQSDLQTVSDDASFRRYFRLTHSGGSLICVDAPPDKEDNESFVRVQALMQAAGVAVPELLAYDMTSGFLLLTDLGDRLLLDELKQANQAEQKALYDAGLNTLLQVAAVKPNGLPAYDDGKLREEMQLFPDWFLNRQLHRSNHQVPEQLLAQVMDMMVENALQQPQVFVHRDFHARNLMLTGDDSFAVIDFQDAVVGPVTYDLVSLLKDCYWRLPRPMVLELVETYRTFVATGVSSDQFLRWFDWMGFQRHLKCAGIFSRLNLRDDKPAYLQDIPLVISYLVEVADLYPELQELGRWLKQDIQPSLSELL